MYETGEIFISMYIFQLVFISPLSTRSKIRVERCFIFSVVQLAKNMTHMSVQINKLRVGVQQLRCIEMEQKITGFQNQILSEIIVSARRKRKEH